MNLGSEISPDPGSVLCKALLKLKKTLGLNQIELGNAIGLNRVSVGRLVSSGTLAPDSTTGELALLLIRIYRSLYGMEGGDKRAMRYWLRTTNEHLGYPPIELISSVEGINRVVEYLDDINGKV